MSAAVEARSAQPPAPEVRKQTGQHLLRHRVSEAVKTAAAAVVGADPTQAGLSILQLRCVCVCMCVCGVVCVWNAGALDCLLLVTPARWGSQKESASLYRHD